MPITYRPVEQIEELEQIADLEMAVWQMDARSAVPSNIMSAIIHHGGHANAAFDGEHMVGMALAFPGVRAGEQYLWSHMAGVLPSYQGRGIGLQLKLEQRRWALANGYTRIRWTFDPLQARNARFNLVYLGAIADHYHVNLYGEMNDGINAGMPSDRLEALWQLDAPQVVALAGSQQPASLPALPADTPMMLISIEQLSPVQIPPDTLCFTVALPASLDALRRVDVTGIVTWRERLREALLTAFSLGYQVTGYAEENGQPFYLLTRKTS